MSGRTRKNEGGAVSNDKDDSAISVEKRVGRARGHGVRGTRPDFTRPSSTGVGEKWFDHSLVMGKAEIGEKNKLGVWERGKFVLWRQYSGKTFDELEDIVPLREFEMEPMYAFASIYWLVMKKMTGKLGIKDTWTTEDMGMLFFMKRLQDANGGCMFTKTLLSLYLNNEEGLRPMGHTITLTNGWVKRARRKGLIEQLPGLKYWRGYKAAVFRISATGRQVLKEFLEAFRRVDNDVAHWAKNNEDRYYLRRYVARFTLGIQYKDLQNEAEDADQTLDEVIELTKSDLRAMGHRGIAGKKVDWWKDLPD
jgi:hypothetical protein